MAPRTYDRMAPIYERLTDAYSLGCSPRAKEHQLTHLEPGMEVLYLGIGPGSEALGAAAKGAHVTGVDLSPKMIEIASARFSDEGFAGDFWAGDLRDYEPAHTFDAVVANFVLDCFDDEARPAVVETMYDLTTPGGRSGRRHRPAPWLGRRPGDLVPLPRHCVHHDLAPGNHAIPPRDRHASRPGGSWVQRDRTPVPPTVESRSGALRGHRRRQALNHRLLVG